MKDKQRSSEYKARNPDDYEKFTALVYNETLAEFKRATKALGYLKKEAVTEAFSLWLAKKRDEIEKAGH